MPLWLRTISAVSYGLLFGVFGIVFMGSLYVMLFVPPTGVTGGSLHKESPLSDKVLFLGALVVMFTIGYVMNRVAWSLLRQRLPDPN